MTCTKFRDLSMNSEVHEYHDLNKHNRFVELHRTVLFETKPTFIMLVKTSN